MHNYINELNANRIEIYKKEHGFIIADHNRERGSMQSYHGRELLELLQNADDEMTEALPKEAYITFRDGVLRISNYGEPFSRDGIKSLTISDLSPKRKKAETYIGNKGTGFRSILGWTQEIYIHSGDLHVKFSEEFSQGIVEELLGEDIKNDEYKAATLVFPEWIEPVEEKSQYTTDIIIKTKLDGAVTKDIETQLRAIDQNILLFLNKMDTLIIEMPGYQAKYSKHINGGKTLLSKTINGETSEDTWRLFKKTGTTYDEDEKKDKPYSIVLAYREGTPLSDDEQRLYSFFKTDVQFPYKFLLHATFLLNQDRNHLIKGTTANEDIVNAAAELMVDAAIILAKRKTANYDIIKLLVDEYFWSGELDGYDFKEALIAVCKNKSIFPNVNGEYMSDGNDMVRDQYGISKYLSGNRFRTLLKHADKDERVISGFLDDTVKYSKYTYDSMCDAVAEWIETQKLKATTEKKKAAMIRAVAHTAGAFLSLYKNDISKKSSRKLPYFFFDADYEQIKSRYVYYSEGETSISRPPACLSVQFLNAEMHHAICRFFEECSLEYSIDDMSSLGLYPFSVDDLAKKCNEIIQTEYDRKLKKAEGDLGLILRWLYKNQASLKNSDVSIILPSKDGSLQKSNHLYLGKEYNNQICEKLFENKKDVLVADVMPLMEKRTSKKNLRDFLAVLGVRTFPMITSQEYRLHVPYYYTQVTDFERSYVNKIINDFKYPFVLEKKKYSNSQELYSSLAWISGMHEEVNHLEYILNNCSSETILEWIASDAELRKRLFDEKHRELIKGGLELLVDDLRNPRPVLSADHPYSYIYHVFYETPWIEFNGKRYRVCDCLIDYDNSVDLSPNIIGIKIAELSKEKKLSDRKRSTYIDVLEKLGAKNGFGKDGFPSFPLSKIYTVLNKISDINGSEKLAKTLYRSIINDGNYKTEDLESCFERAQFLSDGKVLSDKGFLPISRVHYKADNRISKNALSHYNLLEVGTRENAEKVKLLLGVNRLKVKTALLDEPSIHKDSLAFSNDLRDYLPLAFAYRSIELKSDSDLAEKANRMRSLTITLCSEVSVRYNDKYEELLDDYEFALPSPNHIFIKAPDNVDIRHNTKLANVIGDAISTCLDIPSEAPKLAQLYEASDRYLCLSHAVGDDDLIRRGLAAYRSGLNDKEKFVEVLKQLTGKSPEEFKEFANNLDFEKWASSENLIKLLNLFKQLDISVADYNDENPQQPIDFRPYYDSEITRIKYQYQRQYKAFWYQKFKTAPLSDKITFIDKVYEFESIAIPTLNTVGFDVKRAVIDALGIDGKKYRIDPDKEYEKNLKSWKAFLAEEYPDHQDDIFKNSNENTSLLYYGEFDELKERFEAEIEDDIEIESPSFSEPIPNKGVVINSYSTKPIEQAERRPKARPKSVGYSDTHKKIRAETGQIGEEIVYKTLLEDSEYKEVAWVSEIAKAKGINPDGSAEFGYDFRVMDKDGNLWFIEVKSSERSIKDGISFYLSANEYLFAKEHLQNYMLLYVDAINSDETSKIMPLNDLFVNGELNKKKYTVSTDKYHISALIEEH